MIFLNVAPSGQPAQGEAILIRTPENKTILVDGGLDATSLSQTLDSYLPSWQRSLDALFLTTPRADHLNGLLDIVMRYQIGEIIDAGMVHPNTTYARWQRTIREHSLHYIPVAQGTSISIGTQVTFQVLAPSALHKGAHAELDNGLILRMLTPGLHVLLIGVAAQSSFALTGLLSSLASNYFQAEIVQIVGEVDKVWPAELVDVLHKTHPSLLIITPAALSIAQRKAGLLTTIELPASLSSNTNTWQVEQTAQTGTLEIISSPISWHVYIP